MRLDWLRSPLYLDWVYRIDLSGIMYYDRIGDAPILVGTPYALRRLMSAAKSVLQSPPSWLPH